MDSEPRTASLDFPNPAAIPQLLDRRDVARLVGVPTARLTWWVVAYRSHGRYRRFWIPKRNDAGEREINAPIAPLRRIQRSLLDALTPCFSPSPAAHGYIPRRSPATHAAGHVRKEWVLRTDLADFFPTIHFGRVRGLFLAPPFLYPEPVATLLAQICCHEGSLPLGAPTSPLISNMIARRLDRDLLALAARHRCFYSRYADDLVFSTDKRSFPPDLAIRSGPTTSLGPSLSYAIENNGFLANPRKTLLLHRTQRQAAGGLIVNTKINVDRRYVRDLRSILHIWREYGYADATAAYLRTHSQGRYPGATFSLKLTLIGRVQHVGSIKGWLDPVYQRLAHELHELAPDFKFLHRQTAPVGTANLGSPPLSFLFEGPTDCRHFRVAVGWFHRRNEFSTIQVTNSTSADGDAKLASKLRALTDIQRNNLVIGVFDTDNPRVLKDLGLADSESSRDLGKGVYAVRLDHPPWRSPDSPLCVELLYTDADLARTAASGHRIYQQREFDSVTGHHSEGLPVHVTNPKSKTLICEEVYAFAGGGTNLALSKAAFAEAVESGTPPFEGMDFRGFAPTLQVISSIIARHKEP